jgi:hypothetical protein
MQGKSEAEKEMAELAKHRNVGAYEISYIRGGERRKIEQELALRDFRNVLDAKLEELRA